MVILPLVEGHGEVKAAPELIGRICKAQGRYDVRVLPGYRSHRSELANPPKLAAILEAAVTLYRPDAILVLFDADDDCPKSLFEKLQPVCDAARARTAVVAANREYESWFLGAIPSLRNQPGFREDAEPHPDPESRRDAKGQIRSRMQEPYSPTLHQQRFSKAIDLSEAALHCRSFRRLQSAVTSLIEAKP